ncbi:hypothetical protein J7M23_09685 [Candidatus Sumerlaeota bacterium]|nr:hypothetical protein [Candidatus Sumerlaeota bacterium]
MDQVHIGYLAVGIILCLLGWVIYLAGLKIVAVVLGSIIGGVTAIFFAFLLGITQKSYIGILLFICVPIGMVVGLYLTDRVHKLLFFLAGACVGGVCAYLLKPLAVQGGFLSETRVVEVIFFHLIFAGLGGGLAILFSGYVICFITSSVGIFFIAGSLQINSFHILIPIAWISSFVFQCSTLTFLKKQKSN